MWLFVSNTVTNRPTVFFSRLFILFFFPAYGRFIFTRFLFPQYLRTFARLSPPSHSDSSARRLPSILSISFFQAHSPSPLSSLPRQQHSRMLPICICPLCLLSLPRLSSLARWRRDTSSACLLHSCGFSLALQGSCFACGGTMPLQVSLLLVSPSLHMPFCMRKRTLCVSYEKGTAACFVLLCV